MRFTLLRCRVYEIVFAYVYGFYCFLVNLRFPTLFSGIYSLNTENNHTLLKTIYIFFFNLIRIIRNK